MFPLLFMCFLRLLEHPSVLGNPSKDDIVQNINKVLVSYSEKSSSEIHNPRIAYLPPTDEEYFNTKHKRSVKKRSAGRVVDLPADVVNSLMDKPLSYFSTSLEVNRKMIIDCHNKYRSKANPTASNMLQVTWNEDAEKSAGDWANKCIQGHSPSSMRTIPNMRCGENIFLAKYKISWDIVTDCWYSETTDFLFGHGSVNGAEVGHYTQLMWGVSNQMGCAMADCPNLPTRYNFVCHYCPTGNRKPTAYPYKSGKPCGDCPYSCVNNLCTNPCPYMDKYVNCLDYKTGATCGSDQQLIDDCLAMCTCTKGEIK